MKKQLKHFVLAGIALLAGIGLKAQYTGSIDISPIQVSQEKSGTYDVVRIEGCSMTIEPGSPYLPIKELHIALPANKTVSSIQVLNYTQQELKGSYEILPTQYPRIPELQDPGFKEPNIGIYGDNSLYPAIQLSFTGAGFASGVHIAGINYCPLQYNPITKKLVLTTHIEYRVNYTTESNSPIKPRRLTADQVKATREALKAIVDNPNEIDNYFQLEKVDDLNETVFTVDEFPNFEGQPVQYVIITNELMKEGFQEIADWKTKTGRPAVVRTVEWIESYYNGADQAEKVRSFITDAYQNWGAVYFMLGGDVGQVPCRIAWMSHFNNSQLITAIPNGDFIPADMYYACLDGNWNADGDATFGESNWNRLNDGSFYQEQNSLINLDTVDRLPEVYVGRVPVENMSELNYYKTKLFEYLKTSSGNEKNTLLFSADSDYISSSQMDQVGNEFPASFSLTKLYEKKWCCQY